MAQFATLSLLDWAAGGSGFAPRSAALMAAISLRDVTLGTPMPSAHLSFSKIAQVDLRRICAAMPELPARLPHPDCQKQELTATTPTGE
jgi:hypothetical protein